MIIYVENSMIKYIKNIQQILFREKRANISVCYFTPLKHVLR